MLIRFKCNHCGHNVKIDAIHSGKQAKCPGCKEMITIPTAEQADAAAKGIAAGATAAVASRTAPPNAHDFDENPYKSPQAVDEAGALDSESGSPDYITAGNYAGFWLRFCAMFVDGIITNIIQFAMGFAIGFIFVTLGDDSNRMATIVAQIAGVIFQWLYFALMESSSNQGTLGKMVLGIRVTDLEGRRIGFGRATGRHFGKFLSSIILLGGFFMAGFTEKKQGLHDILAGCLVVRKN